VPPPLVQDLTHATYSSIVELSRGFAIHTLGPWLARWEAAISRQLLSEAERRAGVYVEFKLDGLLRGDLKARYDSYATGIQWGIISPNEARVLENLNAREGGDVYLQPLNMVDGTKPAAAKRKRGTLQAERRRQHRF
jgi:HK97 family phage portal protein